jgi:peptidyl-prolyl cis-trans isomerase D
MLSMLRNATKGWVAKTLLVLLVASFAVWGVSGSMLQSSGSSVISVGDTNVGQVEYRLAYDRQLDQVQRQIGSRITREQADSFGVGTNVLTQLVSGALLDESANNMGLSLSKDKLATMIGEDASFRDATGQFSRAQLQQVLRSVGMREDEYIQTRKAVAVRNQIIEGTAGEISLPDAYWKLLGKFQSEERKFEFVELTDKDIAPIADPTDDALKTYYEANLENYMAPEFRKLNIVTLQASDIADEAAVTKEEIEADYEARKASFSSAEKRTIEQLVFTDPAKADAAVEALNSGKTFDEIIASEGKTAADIALGTLAKDAIPDTKIADAVFALEPNQPSELVDGLFGKVLLRVTAIEAGETKPLSEVEAEIRKAIALTTAANDIFETHDKLEDERAAGEPLANAADAANLKMRIVEAIDRTSRDPEGNIINDLPQSRELLAAAFDTDEGVEADPISLGTNGFVWFEVAGITAERQKTFEEVIDTVKSDWLAEETSKAVEALAESVRGKVASGEAFNAVISELLPFVENAPLRIAQQTPAVKRNGTAIGLPQQAISSGFNIPRGDAIIVPGESGTSRIVAMVSDVQAGETTSITDEEKTQFNTLLSDDVVNQLIARIQQDQNVEITRQAIEAALSYNSGY